MPPPQLVSAMNGAEVRDFLNLLHKMYDPVILIRGGTGTPSQILWVHHNNRIVSGYPELLTMRLANARLGCAVAKKP